jgi:signal transduction histidine kinase
MKWPADMNHTEVEKAGSSRGVRRAVSGIHRKQRNLLRIMLIAVLSMLGFNIALGLALAGTAILDFRLLGPILVGLLGGITALGLLKRGHFYTAGILAVASFLAADIWDLARAGLSGHEVILLMFTVPVILAGTVLHRTVLYAVVAATSVAVLIVFTFEAVFLDAGYGSFGAVVLFSLILILLTLFFARFGIALRNSLVYQTEIAGENERLYEETRLLSELLEQRVAERTKELQELNDELESFNYSVSHDLRAPLRGINGFSQVLLEDFGTTLEPEARRYLERIASASERMGELIDGLLEISHLGRTGLSLRDIDVSAVARTVTEELQSQIPNAAHIGIEDGLTARGDSRLLWTVLENLIGNAMKFSQHQPEPSIQFGWCRQANAFFVRDRGIGFDPAFAEKLFLPFQTLHPPDTYEGTGIGLAAAQRIITRHGGRIWAEGRPDRGATFYFTLPDPEALAGSEA